MKKYFFVIIFTCVVVGLWFIYTETFTDVAQDTEQINFIINKGDTVSQIAEKLEQKNIIRNAWIFKKYIALKGLDKKINYGEFTVNAPITLASVASVLVIPGLSEKTITILPGWDLRDIKNYFESNEIQNTDELFKIVGFPAQFPTNVEFFNISFLNYKPKDVSLEGYLAPDTYRIYKDATANDIIEKLLRERNSQFTDKMYKDIKATGRSVHEVLTVASLLEKEVQSDKDRAKVADIFWRRFDENWGLQADSTVHYAVGKKGNIFTTAEDRSSKNAWNTYKYAGLPPGPISNPSIESINAAIYPDNNNYWYFITTLEGDVKFAKTLDEHNANVVKYIRN